MSSKWFIHLRRQYKTVILKDAKIDICDSLYYIVKQYCTELVALQPRSDFRIKTLYQGQDGFFENDFVDINFGGTGLPFERLEMLAYHTCTRCGGLADVKGEFGPGYLCIDCQRGVNFSALTKWRKMHRAAKAMQAVRLYNTEALQAAMIFDPWAHWMTLSAIDDEKAIKTIAQVPLAVQTALGFLQSRFCHIDDRKLKYLSAFLYANAARHAVNQDYSADVTSL
jgi:hypothetical protein